MVDNDVNHLATRSQLLDNVMAYNRQDSTRSQYRNSSSHSSSATMSQHELYEYETNEFENNNSELFHYFMNIAILKAKKRKNYKNQAGACIVNADNKVVGIGNYSSDSNKSNSLFSWFTHNDNENIDNKSRTDYANHAEMQAIMNKTEMNLENCIMFVTAFPCMECAKMILQNGLKHIVYIDDSLCQKQTDQEVINTKHLFQLSGITLTKLN